MLAAAVGLTFLFDAGCAAAGVLLGLVSLKIPYGTLALPFGSLAIAIAGLAVHGIPGATIAAIWPVLGGCLAVASVSSMGLFWLCCERE